MLTSEILGIVLSGAQPENLDYQTVFVELCHSLNNMLKKHIYIDSKLSGSTGVMVMSHEKKLICANVGDSRAVLYRLVDESQLEFIPMSRDQKPSDPAERQRIIAHGGKVHPCRCRFV